MSLSESASGSSMGKLKNYLDEALGDSWVQKVEDALKEVNNG